MHVLRLANSLDADAMAALLGILFSQEADFEPNLAKQRRGLEMILANPDAGKIFCMEKNGAVIGMVNVLFVPSIRHGGMVAWVEDVIVHPRWRGCGHGRRLLKAALQFAREARCVGAVLLTDSSNTRARAFYASEGFELSPQLPMRVML